MKYIYSLILILFSSQGLSAPLWEVSKSELQSTAYVRITQNTSGAELILEYVCDADGVSHNSWGIGTGQNLSKLFNYTSQSIQVDMLVDNRILDTFSRSIGIMEDVFYLKGKYNANIEEAVIKGRTLTVRIKDENNYQGLFEKGGKKEYAFSLKGSAIAIKESLDLCTKLSGKIAQSKIEQAQEEKFLQGITILLIILAFIAAYIALVWLIRKLKEWRSGVTQATKNLSGKVAEKSREIRENKLRQKIHNAALDEIVRELVRKKIRDGEDYQNINICPNCKGAGCAECDNRGWLIPPNKKV